MKDSQIKCLLCLIATIIFHFLHPQPETNTTLVRKGQKRPDLRWSHESIWNTEFGTTVFFPPREGKAYEVAGSSNETKRKLLPSHSHWRMNKTFRQHDFYTCWSSVFTVQINPTCLTNPGAEGQASNLVPFSETFWNSATRDSRKDSLG